MKKNQYILDSAIFQKLNEDNVFFEIFKIKSIMAEYKQHLFLWKNFKEHTKKMCTFAPCFGGQIDSSKTNIIN